MRVLTKRDVYATTTEVKEIGVFDTKEPSSVGYLGPQSYYTATEDDEDIAYEKKHSPEFSTALYVMSQLPDEILDDKFWTQKILEENSLQDMAMQISYMSEDEYHDFIVNQLSTYGEEEYKKQLH